MYWFKSVLVLVMVVVCIIALTSADLQCYVCERPIIPYSSKSPFVCDDNAKLKAAVCSETLRGADFFTFACFMSKLNGTGNNDNGGFCAWAAITGGRGDTSPQ